MSTTLSSKTIETVKATIPFLQQNGLTLTQHFYKRLFEGNPEVKEFFNQSNQSSGTQQQALGAAICAFAQNIETPEKLAGAVSLISNKHASLGIKPEHYPIVGEHLLDSINDLLDPAPPEILEAWSAAYGFLADVLIQAEQSIYDTQAAQEHGWNGFQELEVFKREHESQWITSFYLRAKDGKALPRFKAGQYLTVRIPTNAPTPVAPGCPFTGTKQTTMRNYSLSGSPEWDYYRISVKREVPRHADTPEGYVSSYLHTKIKVGDTLEVAPPCGDFFLQKHEPNTPILLLSGGVGITPLISMLHSTTDQSVTFLHGAINGENHALRTEVLALEKQRHNIKVHFRYSAPSQEDINNQHHHSAGLFSSDFLREFITPETQVYFCGPKPMMQHIYQALKEFGHPSDQTHFEFFGPQDALEG
jgi:nitric oxide dioxygenase